MLGAEHQSYLTQYVGPEMGKLRSEDSDPTTSLCSLEILPSRA